MKTIKLYDIFTFLVAVHVVASLCTAWGLHEQKRLDTKNAVNAAVVDPPKGSAFNRLEVNGSGFWVVAERNDG